MGCRYFTGSKRQLLFQKGNRESLGMSKSIERHRSLERVGEFLFEMHYKTAFYRHRH